MNEPRKAGSNGHLLLVAPFYLSDGRAVSRLFPNAVAIDAASGCYRDPGLDFRIHDLSDCNHQTFNHAMLSSQADSVLLILDATFGLGKRDFWTKALACLASVPRIVLAIDNMALVDWSQERFEGMKEEFTDRAVGLDCREPVVVPVDLASSKNIIEVTSRMPWYDGLPVLELLSERILLGNRQKSERSVQSSDQFAVHLCWNSNVPLLPGRQYLLQRGDELVEATISEMKHRLNPETMEHQAAKKLLAGDIGYCNISLNTPVSFVPHDEDRDRGSFMLVNKANSELVAFGLIKHALRRATNIKWQALKVDKSARATSMSQTPCVLWFTGLSGSGKSAVASLVDKKLHAMGKHTYHLDGDNVRHGLCRDLGFTDVDRVENQRRISETAKLFVDAGLMVLVSFISPFRSERQAAREKFTQDEFMEVFVDTPLDVCEGRDPKGLYKMARAGQLKNFTGIDSPYEPPENVEIVLPGAEADPEELADMVIDYIEKCGLL